MNLATLLLLIGSIALGVTVIVGFLFKAHKNWLLTYLQNFCGVLFIFSGWVKAMDPLGTAYKMEQYFAEFEATFEGTWFSFIAPIFPFFSEISSSFSVAMIVFEIVLGIMLVLGMKNKLTSWAFLLLVAFFTVLTGFTFLTGYVPSGENFFSFGAWDVYKESNMKVTDCGCFGDFIKLEPKVSFLKDVFLLIPAIFFVFKHKDMHELFSEKVRKLIVAISTVGVLFYCFSNYVWDIPHTDFRPFKKGANVAEQRALEEEAMANVQIVSYKLQNLEDESYLEIPYNQYLTEYKNYPKDKWKVIDQIQTEPTVKKTKISDFDIEGMDGDYITDRFFSQEKPIVMIVSYEMPGEGKREITTSLDTLYKVDTVMVEGVETLVESIDQIVTVENEITNYYWQESFKNEYIDIIKPFAEEAKKDGWDVITVFGGADETMIKDFEEETELPSEFGIADDILLKTIVRSNPGVVLWKDGVILNKWHKSKLPEYKSVKEAGFNH